MAHRTYIKLDIKLDIQLKAN